MLCYNRKENNMSVNKFKKLLKSKGFSYLRQGKGSHEVWINAEGKTFSFSATHDIHNGIVWNFKRNFV